MRRTDIKEQAKFIQTENVKNKETANDLHMLLGALPLGQIKQLLKDETCAAILAKYGITGESYK